MENQTFRIWGKTRGKLHTYMYYPNIWVHHPTLFE